MEEHARIEVDGRALEIVSLEGDERISTLFRFDMLCAAPASVDALELLGQAGVVTLADRFGAEREIHGIVAEVERGVFDDGGTAVALALRPAVFPLTLGRDSRSFQDATVAEIVDAVLAPTKASWRWELLEEHAARPYTAQVREDDWTFVCRLLEDEGIYAWFDHDDPGTSLVLSDASTSAPDLRGGAWIEIAGDSGLSARREVVSELGVELRATATRFSVASFNPERPAYRALAAAGDGPHETYEPPGGASRSPEACARRARLLEQTAAAQRLGVAGATSSVRLVPGRVVEMGGHQVSRLDGRYLVTASTCSVVQRRRFDAGGVSYRCRFRAVPQARPFRAPAGARRPPHAGVQLGAVVGTPGQEIHPDAAGRVRVRLHADRRDELGRSGTWMRVAQRPTAGSMLLPRVGWNVLSFHDDGDPDAPSVVSRIFDAEHPPPYALPANKTRTVYKTATTPGGGSFNEIAFEDQKGGERMTLRASRDRNLLVNHEKTEHVTRDAKHTVAGRRETGVGEGLTDSVTADQRVSVAGDERLTVAADRTRTVDGTERETVAGRRSVHAGESHVSSVTGTRELRVGAVLVDAALGPIRASAGRTVSVLVGGARVRVSASSIVDNVLLASVETVGGVKLELAGRGQSIRVKGKHVETVGGAMVLKTPAGFFQATMTYNSWRAGAAIYAEGPALTVRAAQQILLVCGKSSILIDPGGVEIRAASISVDGGQLTVAKKGKVDLNEG